MAEIIIMPKLGFNMSKGKLVKWNKVEGDSITKGEDFFEMETDKTTIPIEATISGTVLKLLIEEGTEVPVTTPIAIIGEKNENVAAVIKNLMFDIKDDNKEEDTALSENEKMQSSDERSINENLNYISGNIKVTPRGRRFLSDNNLDIEILKNINGTGFEQGVTERDIKVYIENNNVRATPLAKKLAAVEGVELNNVIGSGYKGKILKSDIESSILKDNLIEENNKADVYLSDKIVFKEIPYKGVRKVIGDRLSESKVNSPHVYFTVSVDANNLTNIRKLINESKNVKVSINDLIVVAVGKVLKDYPMLNSSLIGDSIIQYKSINIGVAVAADSGLIVPVIKNVQDKDLIKVANEAHALLEKAKNGKLIPDEYSNGTFTISNLGMFNIDYFTAIINPPESAILAISSIKKTPIVVTENGEDKIVIKPIFKMTLSVDHRIIDGLLATQFINGVKDLLENPISILL